MHEKTVPLTSVHEATEDSVFRLLVDGIGDYGIFMLTPEGNIASWNSGAQSITGYRAEDVTGRHFSIFYTPEAIARRWPQYELERAAADGRFEDEGWRVRKDGSRFWANVVITALRDEKGGLKGYSKITRDLSERKRQEEELRHSEERLRLLIEGVKDYAIYMLDPDGNVMSWNVGAQRIKGYTADEIIGQSFSRFYTQEDLAIGKPWTNLEAARRHGSINDGRCWRVRKDGTRFMADVVLTALYDDGGTLRGYAKITRDITQTTRIETLEAEGRRTNEFLAMLAHELRNPLASIRNAVSLLETPALSASQANWCRSVIDRQTAHLTRLVDDLLDVSRITTGKVTVHSEELDLATIVNRGVEAALPLIQARRQQLSVDLAAQPVHLFGDLTRLVQVMSNLLHNAAKYTAEGGRIDVSARAEGEYAVIRVRDNGIGMPADLIEKVFMPFQQGERTLARSEGGLGLGLTLAQRIVVLHGGSIEAYSEGVGHGSEFVVRLPFLSAEQAPQSPAAEPERPREQPLRRLRVLIVEDNQDAAATMAMLIEALDNDAQTVFEGSAAAQAAREYRPDLALIDIGLPGMDGYAVARQFNGDPELGSIRLVAVTGYGQEEDKQRAREAGFDDFIVKPVSLERLAEQLQQLREARS